MGKWLGGILATVVAGVLTWWLTEGFRHTFNAEDTKPVVPARGLPSAGRGSEQEIVFDFLAEAPRAHWTSGFGSNQLPFNGRRDDRRGFAVWINGENLEDGSRPQAALLTHPEWKDDDQGQITGDFTLREAIRTGDRFIARVGFLADNRGEVEFVIEAYGGSLRDRRRLSSARDNGNDQSLKDISADMTTFAGGTHVTISVNAGATSGEDQAVWVNPMIVHERKND